MAVENTETRTGFWRSSKIAAWGMLLLVILASILLTLLYILNQGNALALITTLASGLLPLSGAVIITRQSRNLVGWLAAAIGFDFLFTDLFTQYGTYALITHPGPFPLSHVIAWISSWGWMLVYSLAIPFLLLVPDGRLLTRRWAILIWAGLISNVPEILFTLLMTTRIDPVILLKSQNFGDSGPLWILLWRSFQVWMPLQFTLILLALISVVIRFVRSRDIERQQLKWILLAVAFIPLAVGLGFISGMVNDPLLNAIYQVINFIPPVAFPLALAIAVTRYHLYDIDVIIRRTLVYTSVTLVLGLVYFGCVILLQELFTLLTGQRSPVSIVLSTVVIILLFSPLRSRLQAWINRRFYRPRYDTQQMLERFASHQRETIDPDQFNQQLVGVIEDALQPEFVTLWMAAGKKVNAHAPVNSPPS